MTDLADIVEWKEAVRRRARQLRIAIESNALRLKPDDVQRAKDNITAAMAAVGVEDTES